MTPTLTHPPAEDLGRFVEGTLDDAERTAVVTHIADCDECRIVVVDAAEFIEPAVVHSERRWWVAAAAGLLLVVAGSGFIYNETHDQLAKTREAYAQLSIRPFEPRLSKLPYVPWKVMRSGNREEPEIQLDIMKSEAAALAELRGRNAKTFDKRGIGLLLTDRVDDAVASLEEATKRKPNDPQYLSDLAAAFIVAGRKKSVEDERKQTLRLAVDACDRALQIDPTSQEALFNRAIALEALDRKDEASKTYQRYLKVDPSSKWAEEVRTNQERLP